MKRFALTGIIFCLLLSGCGGGGDSHTETASNASPLTAPSLLQSAVLTTPSRRIMLTADEAVPVLSSTGTLTVNCFFTTSENLASAPHLTVYSTNGQPLAEDLPMTVSPLDKNRWSYSGQIIFLPEMPEVQGLKTVLVSWQDKNGATQSRPVGIFHYGETPNTTIPTLLDSRADSTDK